MKIKKIIIIMLIMVVNIFINSPISSAVGLTIAFSKSEASIGDTVDVIVNGNGITGKVVLTVSGNATLSDNSVWVENDSKTVKLQIKGEGNIKVTATPVNVANSNTAEPFTTPTEATIKVNNGATDNNNNSNTSDNNETNNNTSNKKSSEARLSNVWFEPKKYDFSGFRKNTTSYNLNVPHEAEEITVKATTVHKNAKVDGTGKVKLKEGTNTITLKVTAEDGKTTKTYTFKVTRTAKTEEPKKPTEENTDKNESNPNNTEKNNNVQKEQEGETSNETIDGLGLTSLSIKDHNLSPKFDAKTYEYTVGIKEDISSLDIQTKTNSENATVEIIGNENLQQGENVITILVNDSVTQEVATYQIIVNKNLTPQEIIGKVDWLKPSTWGLKEKLIVGAVIALIVVIVVVAIIKIRLSRVDDDDFDLPGADELDRALSEHQELTFDETSSNDKKNDDVNDFFSTPTSESAENKEEPSLYEVKEESSSKEEEKNSKLRRSEIPEDFFEKPSYSSSSRKKGKHF